MCLKTVTRQHKSEYKEREKLKLLRSPDGSENSIVFFFKPSAKERRHRIGNVVEFQFGRKSSEVKSLERCRAVEVKSVS